MFFDYDIRWLYPTNSPLSRTVVISDSMYQEMQQERAKQDILVLESKLNRYKAAVAELEQEIESIKAKHKLSPANQDDLWSPGPDLTFKDTEQGNPPGTKT